MSRSLLLVVCDFLLLSILALARFDVPEDATIAEDGQKIVSNAVIERISDGENYDDVVAELEATNQTLLENLSDDKNDLLEQKLKLEDQIAQRKKELEEKENQIASRDALIADKQKEIQRSQEEARELQRKREEIEKKREDLLKTNAASQKELELLSKNLAEAKKKSEQLAELKAKTEKEAAAFRVELAKSLEKAKAEEKAAAEAKAQLEDEKRRSDALVASTSKIDEKIDSLNQGLQGVGKDLKVVGEGLAGVGDKITSVTEDVNSVKKDMSRVGEEMAGVKKTVDGVGTQVESIKKDVEDSVAEQEKNFKKLTDVQAKSVNEIFTRYEQNKINLQLNFTHNSGFLTGVREESFLMDSIIMVDGSFAYCLVHTRNSPFRLEPSTRKLIKVSGKVSSSKLKDDIQVKEVAFMDDPRILIVPLYINPIDLTKSSEIQVFKAPENPYLFSEAVVIDSKTGRFCQTDFVRDERDSRYIKVKHTSFAFITGEFDPGKGDLVFSQKGELLGIMVNNDYAFHVKNLGARIHSGSRTPVGSSFVASKTNSLIVSLNKKLSGLQKKFR